MKKTKKENQTEKQPVIDAQPATVFAGNTDVKNTRSYSLQELFHSRKTYYILCASLIGVSIICTSVDYGLSDKRSYSDFPIFTVTDVDKQFNMTAEKPNSEGLITNDYYLYYYTSTCSACQILQPSIFTYIESIALSADPEILYLAQLDALYDIENFSQGDYSVPEFKEHLIGASSSEDLVSVFTQTYITPTLLHIRNGSVKSVFVGEEIFGELELRDYNNYLNIADVSRQLSQEESAYYIYYYDYSADSRDLKRDIYDYLDTESHSPLYFANAEKFEIIDETIADDNNNNGTSDNSAIRIPRAPFMLKIDSGIVKDSFGTAEKISAELGL